MGLSVHGRGNIQIAFSKLFLKVLRPYAAKNSDEQVVCAGGGGAAARGVRRAQLAIQGMSATGQTF